MDADVTPSGKVVMFVSVFCTDCRTIFPSILELNLTSAGTGGLFVGCPKYCLLRNPGKKNSYSIAISLLVKPKACRPEFDGCEELVVGVNKEPGFTIDCPC